MKHKNILVLLIGGLGSRFGSKLPKQFYEINFSHLDDIRKKITQDIFQNKSTFPLFELTLRMFLFHLNFENVLIVIPDDYIDSDIIKKSLLDLEKDFPEIRFYRTSGGDIRHESFINAIQFLKKNKIIISERMDQILVHDGNRPFLDKSFQDNIKSAIKSNLSCVRIPVLGTVNSLVETDSENKKIKRYLNRERIFEVQTPQIIPSKFLFDVRIDKKLDLKEYTDEGSFFHSMGYEVVVYEGSRNNLKITFKEDL